MIIYHLKTCDTCRKARKALGHLSPDLVDIREDGIARDKLSDWLGQLGPNTLINKRSKTWRDLPSDMKAADPLDLVIAHPVVMKRPIIEFDGQLFVGWTADVKAKLLA